MAAGVDRSDPPVASRRAGPICQAIAIDRSIGSVTAVNQMIFVFPHRSGGWAVQREGTNRVGRRAPTFEQALELARRQAGRDGAEVEVRSTHPAGREERRLRE
jgi:hypothetical protein